MATLDKTNLFRVLITKICQEKQVPELKYDEWFYGQYSPLIKKLIERKSDLPSLEYITEKYGFEPFDSSLTMTDIFEELDAYYIKERTVKIVEGVIPEMRKNNGDIRLVLDKIQTEFSETRQAVTKAYTVDIAKDKDKIVEEYKKTGEGGMEVPTGFSKLDEIIHPRTGNVLLLCAGTGAGKSLNMIRMMTEAMKQGIPAMYFSLEMGLIEITNRMIAAYGKYDFYSMLYNKITPEEYSEAIEEINKTSVVIVTRQSESKIDLATIERYVQEHKPRVVFLDYLTLVDGIDASWNAEISPSAILKRIALQNDCLLVTAVQADTDALRSGEIPQLTNVRGNKGFSFDCDIFVGMASERFEIEPGRMRMAYAVRKSRNGGFPEFQYKVRPNIGEWLDATGDTF